MFEKFEWDAVKSESNFRKHGIRFEEAIEIFDGPFLTRTTRQMPGGERRDLSLGELGKTVVVAVVHTDRSGRTRIISARPACRSERREFNSYIETTLGRDRSHPG